VPTLPSPERQRLVPFTRGAILEARPRAQTGRDLSRNVFRSSPRPPWSVAPSDCPQTGESGLLRQMNPSKSTRTNRRADDAALPTDGPDRAQAVIDKLYELAIQGSVSAAGLFLDRTLGPIPSPPGLSERMAPRTVNSRERADAAPNSPETKPASPPRRLLSVKQVAHDLGLSARTVSTLITKGHIQAVRIGRRVLLPVAEVERFVQDHSGAEELP
jgi:excisionase family DNA binding protein